MLFFVFHQNDHSNHKSRKNQNGHICRSILLGSLECPFGFGGLGLRVSHSQPRPLIGELPYSGLTLNPKP